MENQNLKPLIRSYKTGFLLLLISISLQLVVTSLLVTNIEETFVNFGEVSQYKIDDFKNIYLPLIKFFSFLCVSVFLYGLFILYSSTSNYLKKSN